MFGLADLRNLTDCARTFRTVTAHCFRAVTGLPRHAHSAVVGAARLPTASAPGKGWEWVGDPGAGARVSLPVFRSGKPAAMLKSKPDESI